MLDRISSLFSRQTIPFASTKAIESWWNPLNELDAASQIQKTQNAVSGFFTAGQQLNIESLRALLWLDNAIQPAFEAICFQYVSNPRMPKEIEQRLWAAVCSFCQCMLDAYGFFIQSGGHENSNNIYDADMHQLLARSLRYISIQIKWHYFRFEEAPSKLWLTANQYYRLSEIHGCDSDPFTLYPSVSQHVTSCADEFIQMLVLATLSSNNLTTMQINWVDQWLEDWSKLLQLSRKYQKDIHHYYVVLQETTGPKKIGLSAEDGENNRYWGVSELVSKIRDIQACIEKGTHPKNLGLGEDCSSIAAIELLKHLNLFWTMGMRNTRIQRAERLKVEKSAHILRGLDAISTYVKTDNDRHQNNSLDDTSKADFDEVLDMRLYGFVSERTKNKSAHNLYSAPHKEPDWQTWSIDNESVGGLGTIFSYKSSDWVRPGLLVGVQIDGMGNWQIGVLRRLNKINIYDVYAGIQILATAPVAVSMHSTELDDMNHITVSELGATGSINLPSSRVALYLPHRVGEFNVNTLIMRAADYSHKRVYQIRAQDKVFSVRLESVLEKGIDWTWVAVNVLRKHVS